MNSPETESLAAYIRSGDDFLARLDELRGLLSNSPETERLAAYRRSGDDFLARVDRLRGLLSKTQRSFAEAFELGDPDITSLTWQITYDEIALYCLHKSLPPHLRQDYDIQKKVEPFATLLM